jgi:ankyrin repeat protein
VYSCVEKGASLDVVDSSGDTALHLACRNGEIYVF